MDVLCMYKQNNTFLQLKTGDSMFETGDIKFSYNSTQTGFLLCDGAVYNSTDYPALAALLGAGATFTVPDLRGRVPVGAGAGTGLSARALGDIGGSERVTLDEDELPAHKHLLMGSENTNGCYDSPSGRIISAGQKDRSTDETLDKMFSDIAQAQPLVGLAADSIAATGSGAAHENMPPFLALYFLIKT